MAKQNDAPSRDFSFHRAAVNVTNVKEGSDGRMEVDTTVC